MFELLVLLMVPVAMAVILMIDIAQTALLMLIVVSMSLAFFFVGYESCRPTLRQVMPTLAFAALAAAGRILFAPVPSFKPLSAIAIIAGASLGRRNGFMVGALAALVSNVFFGQGMWSPWQMYAWGVIGYLGGVCGDAGLFERPCGRPRRAALVVCGMASGLIYGFFLNAYGILGFVRPLTLEGAAVYLTASLPFDLMHGVSTALFLLILYAPWMRRAQRVVRKFALRSS